MRKFITALLALVMVSVMSVSASAAAVDQDSDSKSADTAIKTSIAPSYTVTIPADTVIDFNAASTDFGSVRLDAALLGPGKAVRVSVAPGALHNDADAAKVIPYKVMDGTNEFTSAEYKTAGAETALTIAITQNDWNNAFAGTYSGTVTFTADYVDAAG